MRIGIDLGGTNIAAAVVDENNRILVKDSVPTESQRSFEEIIRDMGALCLDLTERAGLTLGDIQSVGIGSPGTPDIARGRLLYANNLHWDDVPLCDELKKYVGDRTIHLDNDANCAALGEYIAGAGEKFRTSVMVTLGTGVGGGIIIDDRVYSGHNFAGGEIGHIVIVTGGVLCTCGRRGCWENYASVTGLIRMAGEGADRHPDSLLNSIRCNGRGLNGRNIFEAAKTGDSIAKAVVDQYIYYVAEGITNILNIFQPDGIVVGGGISNEGDYLLDPIRAQVARDRYCKHVPAPEIIKAQLGNDAGIIGAAIVGDYQMHS